MWGPTSELSRLLLNLLGKHGSTEGLGSSKKWLESHEFLFGLVPSVLGGGQRAEGQKQGWGYERAVFMGACGG